MKLLVVVSAFAIALCLAVSTRDLNFVGSDEENLYLPAARQMPFVNYPSQLCHSFAFDNPQLVHGKEVSIWHFSLMQSLLHDRVTLRPFLLTVILAWALSAVFLFWVSAFYWGERAGAFCYLAFVTSFWPFVYVLLVKHQPIGLCYFLAAVLALQQLGSFPRKRESKCALWGIVSGMLMAASLHASTVSPLYVPFYLAALYYQCRTSRSGWRLAVFAAAGGAAVVYYLNYPHVIGNIREFLDYVNSSRSSNHFSFHQNVFRAWLANPAQAYGGWEWTFKYLFLAMPVLFPVYLVAIVYMTFRRQTQAERTQNITMAALSFSPALLANISHVAQYGGNYFPCFIGVTIFLGYAFKKQLSFPRNLCHSRGSGNLILLSIFFIHIIVNSFIFFTDLYPGRMASVYLSRALRSLQAHEIFIHPNNPMDQYVIGKIDPKVLADLQVRSIDSINQVRHGYIVLAPLVGSSIYLAMVLRHSDFDTDIYLNELVRKRALDDYAAGSFKTMASSRIWRQEEEMLSYRDLVLGQFSKEYEYKSRAWILDAGSLYRGHSQNVPNAEFKALVLEGIRNIGTHSDLYRYKGVTMRYTKEASMGQVSMRLFKTGDPKDQVVMYVYKYQPFGRTATWLPWTARYASQPLDSQVLSQDPQGKVVPFVFDPPLDITPGDYDIVVYRTGADSDKDFYRVYVDDSEKSAYKEALK